MHKTGFRTSKWHIFKIENTSAYFGYCLLLLLAVSTLEGDKTVLYSFFICSRYNTVQSDPAWSTI